MSKTTTTPSNITRDDLEHKLRAFQDGIQGKVQDKKSTLMTIGIGVGVLMLIVFFLLGRRSGKKKTTFVEIRRI